MKCVLVDIFVVVIVTVLEEYVVVIVDEVVVSIEWLRATCDDRVDIADSLIWTCYGGYYCLWLCMVLLLLYLPRGSKRHS